ncbi:alpha/beta hydrolase [Thermodesulfobacteriota bacterium]
MKSSMKFVPLLVIAIVAATWLSASAKLEPWPQIEARTKFLRTNHYIEVVRVHSEVYKSARSKKGQDRSPFPVHVVLPKNYHTDTNRRYGVVYLLGGKSGWDNGPEKGGATYWSVWCKTPLTMDHLKRGDLTKIDFQDNISDEELDMFNSWLGQEPYEDLIAVCLWNPGGSNTTRYQKYLIGEVIPFIDAHYRTIPDRRFRGIDGACAGAAQAIMISARRPDVFANVGGQQTDLGSYPGTGAVFRQNIRRIKKAGGISYNLNTNVRDGCNSYSNRGRVYQLVRAMENAGFPVSVHVFKSCPHGYCAYRYPNGHQALYWFSQQFKKNFQALGINQNLPRQAQDSPPTSTGSESSVSGTNPRTAKTGPLPGLW